MARFYGGMTFQGHYYWIDHDDKDAPLVRDDVFKRERKESKDKEKTFRDAERKKWIDAQETMFNNEGDST